MRQNESCLSEHLDKVKSHSKQALEEEMDDFIDKNWQVFAKILTQSLATTEHTTLLGAQSDLDGPSLRGMN